MKKDKNILILEDDVTLSAGIVSALKQDNFTFIQCYSIEEARIALKDRDFDLLMLDVNLPDGNGVELCKEVRNTSNIPIMLLTVKDLETDIVYGLDAGADDYITKPFTLMVLRARVNALLRRLGDNQNDKEVSYTESPFLFDYANMIFKKNGESIELSKTEQRLLRLLTSNKNQIMEKGLLVDRLWTDSSEYVDENALSVTVKRLREKLEDNPSKPEYIKNVYGQGYKWEVLK